MVKESKKEREMKEEKEKGSLPITTGGGLRVMDVSEIKLPEGPVGLENIEKDDLIVPRIRLLQPLSKDVTEKGKKPGEFVNSITGESYPTTMEVLIFHSFKSWVRFGEEIGDPVQSWPYAEMKGHEDTKWGPDGEAPVISLVYNYPLLVLNAQNPVIPVAMSLLKTGVKVAKQLNTRVMMSNSSWWDTIYSVSSELVTSPKGTYYTFKIEPLRDADETEKKVGYKLYQQFGGKIEVSMEKEEEVAE